MISEWENGCQKIEKQRDKDPWAPKGETSERKSKQNGIPVRIFSTSDSLQDIDFLCCQEDPYCPSALTTWTHCYKSDPCIALGKYSPLEKEILRLGGVHTIASRRFLAYKQEEERKMLKELQLLSSDYEQAREYKKQHFPSCATGRPIEKIWTARVILPPEELKMPWRERLNISKHIQRMQFARALSIGQLLPYNEQFGSCSFLPGGALVPRARGEAGEEERDEAEKKTTERQEIEMSVSFKSEEPEVWLTHQPSELKPFFPTKKAERSITGLTNRNLFRIAEFPGDLMLMKQESLSRGFHPSDLMKANYLEEECILEEDVGTPACHHY